MLHCMMGRFYHLCLWMIITVLLTGPSLAQDSAAVPAAVAPTAGSAVISAPDAAKPAAPATADKPLENVITNPFVSGGVVGSGQVITRDEVLKLIADMEKRVKADVTQGIDATQVNRLIAQATTASNGAGGANNFIGCVNGVPLYRAKDGSLSFGADEPGELRLLRCRK